MPGELFPDRIHRHHSSAHAFTGAEPGPGSARAVACTSESGAAGPGARSRTAVARAAESRADAGTHPEPAANGLGISAWKHSPHGAAVVLWANKRSP